VRAPSGAVRPLVVPDASEPEEAARVWALLDPELLAEAGFEPGSDLLVAPTNHPLLGYAACAIDGCLRVRTGNGMCLGCRQRFDRSGLSRDEFVALGVSTGRAPRNHVVSSVPRGGVRAARDGLGPVRVVRDVPSTSRADLG
jgi:hypothetical protein